MMDFVSTRGDSPSVGLSEAIVRGLAPDGGLYVPATWPCFEAAAFRAGAPLAEVAATALTPFAEGDALAPHFSAITREAFNFAVPLTTLNDDLGVLELFHGPTAAFKDFGARFLAGCLTRLRAGAARPLQILVATSGDTGGAVAAAFHGKPGIEVAVLYPQGKVSPIQEQQLTCWSGNVRAFAVRGTFDDCQALVKGAFASTALTERFDLSSANSINIGRLLPQMTYFMQASSKAWRERGEKLSFVVPSGNLGHATACVWARRCGAPIGEIVLAHNANRTLPDYYASGEWRPRRSVATLASAMDVGDPSNAERLFHFCPDPESFRAALSVYAVDDGAIRARIQRGFTDYGQIWCPHTATAAEAFEQHKAQKGAPGPWALVATAHPAKFSEIVAPLIGATVAAPPALADLMARTTAKTEIDADLAALVAAL